MNWLAKIFGAPSVPQISPHDAHRRQKDGALLIDVREVDEWQSGHASDARHIPLGQLSRYLSTLPQDREILFICRSGNRSGQATAQARAAGLSAVNISGGTIAWISAGLPLRRGKI